MKRLTIHKGLVTLLLVIFTVVVMHMLQSMRRSDGKKSTVDEEVHQHLLAR